MYNSLAGRARKGKENEKLRRNGNFFFFFLSVRITETRAEASGRRAGEGCLRKDASPRPGIIIIRHRVQGTRSRAGFDTSREPVSAYCTTRVPHHHRRPRAKPTDRRRVSWYTHLRRPRNQTTTQAPTNRVIHTANERRERQLRARPLPPFLKERPLVVVAREVPGSDDRSKYTKVNVARATGEGRSW